MNIANKPNGIPLETIFHSRPRREEPAIDLYLRRQAAEARAALTNSTAKVRRNAVGLVSPTLWASRHPLATVGAAAIAGVIAARFLLPPSRQRDTQPEASTSPESIQQRPTRRWLGMVVDSLVGAGMGALTQTIMTSVTSALMATNVPDPASVGDLPDDVADASPID
jgi:hypothetical protein